MAQRTLIAARTMFAIQPEDMEAFRHDVLAAIDAVAIIHFGPPRDGNISFLKDSELKAFFKMLETVIERDRGGVLVDFDVQPKVDIIV